MSCAKPTRAPPALWIRTIAGGAWSPAVAATGRTAGGLSEGRAGKQRDQRESSKKRFHHTSPELTDGLSVVPAIAAGRRPVPCSCCPSPFVDRVEWAFIPKQRPRTHVNSTRDCDCSRSHPEAETRFGEPEDYFGILPVSLGDAVKSKRSKSGQVAGETRGFFSRYLR